MSRFSRAATPLPAQPSCEQVGRVLQSFVDGELGPQDAERVAEHLEHCDRCGIEVEVVDRVIHAIRRQRPGLDTDMLARLEGFVGDIDRHA